jgi:hypothetical protein
MKFSHKKHQKILTNKYLLYFMLFITCIFLLYLILAKNIGLIILFILIAFVIRFYNKNMIIILGISLIFTYIATLGIKIKEGMITTGP